MRSQINHFKLFIPYKKTRKKNTRQCDICNVDVHRASYVKHFRKKTLENEKQIEMIIHESLFQEPIENNILKINYPKTLKQIAIENIKLADKQLNKELAKNMISSY